MIIALSTHALFSNIITESLSASASGTSAALVRPLGTAFFSLTDVL
jgi:hypothetical protein